MYSHTHMDATYLFTYPPAHLLVTSHPLIHLSVFHILVLALSPFKHINPLGLKHTTSTVNTAQISFILHTHPTPKPQAHSYKI